MSVNPRGHRLAGKFAAFGCGAVLLASCGGGSTSTSTAITSTVKIGDLAGFTGADAGFGPAFSEGAQVAMNEINGSGGIQGQQLQIVNADDLSNPIDTVTALQRLINVDKVAAIIGPQTPEMGAAQPIIDRDHVPDMFQGGSTDFDKNADTWVWRGSSSDSQQGVAMSIYAIGKGYKNAAIMFSTEPSAQTLKPLLKATFEKLGGHIVTAVDLTVGQPSYRNEVLSVVALKPDVIFTHEDAVTAGTLFSDFQQANNFAIPFVGTDSTASGDWYKAVGYPVANAHLVSLIGGNEPGGGGDVFNTWYGKTFNHQPLANANYAYDSVIVLALAIEKANSTDPQAIVNAIPEVSNPPGQKVSDWATAIAAVKAGTKINYDGASGPMDFDQYHNVFGPFDAVVVDLQGNLQTVKTFTADELKTATT